MNNKFISFAQGKSCPSLSGVLRAEAPLALTGSLAPGGAAGVSLAA